MHYEFYGSFLVLGFISIFGKVRNRYILYVLAILITLNDFYLPFFLGVILSDLFNSKNNIVNKLNKIYIKIIFIVCGVLLASYPTADIDGTIYAFSKINLIQNFITTFDIKNSIAFFRTIGAFMLIIVLLNSYKAKKFFSHRIFTFLGSISFTMYLIHIIIICSFSSFLFLKLVNNFRYYQAFFIMVLISFMLIISSSYYMYKYIDLPAIKISKKIYKKYFN